MIERICDRNEQITLLGFIVGIDKKQMTLEFLPSSAISLNPLRTTELSERKIKVMEEPLDSIASGIVVPHNFDPIRFEEELSPSLTSR